MLSEDHQIIKKRLTRKFVVDKIAEIARKHSSKKHRNLNIEELKKNIDLFIKKKRVSGKTFWGYGIHRIDNSISAKHSSSLGGSGMYLSFFKEQNKNLRFIFAKIDYSNCIISEIDEPKLDSIPLNLIEKAVIPRSNSPYLELHSKLFSGTLSLGIDEMSSLKYYVDYLNQSREHQKTHKIEIKKKREDLRELLSHVKDGNQNKFLKEAITCLEVEACRASIIMTWNMTIDHIFNYILQNSQRLQSLNTYLSTRLDRQGNAVLIRNKDDFAKLKESEFISACKKANIISNDVRKILEEKLGIRNTCAHPSDVTIKHTKAVDFIDDLITNVLLKYNL